jgi:multidrug efflux pump subunit AcrB
MDDLRPGKPEIQLRLREGAFGLGLDATEIARQLRAAYHGSTADEIQVGAESFEIDVRLAPAGQDSLGDLDEFEVALPGGRRVPLSAVALLETGRGVSRIARVDGRRTVTVRGEVDNQVSNLNQILAMTSEQFMAGLLARYPDVSISLEGEAEEQDKTGSSLQRGFLMGLLGVFLLLSFQFKSYIEPVIVMVAIPLALIGVIWGHIAMGLDLTMPSMLGAISLAGVVVNDSILLVAFVKLGMAAEASGDVVMAACQAARDRFRPVLLTSLTTIAGLLPLLFEKSLQAQVLVPLVTSLAFGLMASTALVLVVVPTLYAILHDFGLTTVARDERAGSTAAPG